jgi:hypothetical protein
MTTEEALDSLVADLRGAFPDHRAADFSGAYRVVRDWFRVPITDRQDEVFQLVCGPLTSGNPKYGYFSLCRILRRPIDGAFVQAWVVLSDRHGSPEGPDWSSHCWYGRDFAGPDETFVPLEGTAEFGLAAKRRPWHVQVSWQRGGEPVNPAVVFDDLLHVRLSRAPRLRSAGNRVSMRRQCGIRDRHEAKAQCGFCAMFALSYRR